MFPPLVAHRLAFKKATHPSGAFQAFANRRGQHEIDLRETRHVPYPHSSSSRLRNASLTIEIVETRVLGISAKQSCHSTPSPLEAVTRTTLIRKLPKASLIAQPRGPGTCAMPTQALSQSDTS
jgi:hypothetical protein